MARFVSAAFVVAILLGGCSRSQPTWSYNGELHKAIEKTDRIVVYDAGYDYYGKASKAKPIREVSDAAEVQRVAGQLEFEKKQVLTMCPCTGYPRIDWYRGKDRIAIVSVQHGETIRWKGFQGDARLTPKSSQFLVQWLGEHGVSEEKMK
jgi:hypothetical protein